MSNLPYETLKSEYLTLTTKLPFLDLILLVLLLLDPLQSDIVCSKLST